MNLVHADLLRAAFRIKGCEATQSEDCNQNRPHGEVEGQRRHSQLRLVQSAEQFIPKIVLQSFIRKVLLPGGLNKPDVLADLLRRQPDVHDGRDLMSGQGRVGIQNQVRRIC